MALSERAVGFIERRLEARRPLRRAVHARAGRSERELTFRETMSGTCMRARDGMRVRVSFTVEARGPRDAAAALRTGCATLPISGTATVYGTAESAPCAGALTIRPGRVRGNVTFDLSFVGTDGATYTLHGEKHAGYLMDPVGMTRLHTSLRREGEPFAEGLLRFGLRDLRTFLACFRLRRREALAEDALNDVEAAPTH
jgi:hypothetical protein